jgi:recombinational DNA repair protein (RecF pathway)
LFFAFEWELLARHGMAPELASCISCGRDHADLEPSSLRFSAAEGGIVCGTCSRGDGINEGRPLGSAAFAHLQDMSRTGIDLKETEDDGEPLPRQMRRELGALLHGFLGYHLPGYRLPTALELLRAGKEKTG